MKKFFVLILLFLLFIIGCSERANIAETETKEIENCINYEITEDIYSYYDKETRTDININYPQIKNLDSDLDEQEINELIRSEAMLIFKRYKENNENEDIEFILGLTLDIKYEIKFACTELLSVVYYGEGYLYGAAHPNKWFYSINIDIPNVEKLRLEDFIIIDERLLEMLRDGQFTLVSPSNMEGFEYSTGLRFILGLPADEAIGYISRADALDDIYNDTYSYLTDSGLGISFCTAFSIGGHAEYEIPFKELGDIHL